MTLFRIMGIVTLVITAIAAYYGGLRAAVYVGLGIGLGTVLGLCYLYDVFTEDPVDETRHPH